MHIKYLILQSGGFSGGGGVTHFGGRILGGGRRFVGDLTDVLFFFCYHNPFFFDPFLYGRRRRAARGYNYYQYNYGNNGYNNGDGRYVTPANPTPAYAAVSTNDNTTSSIGPQEVT